MLWSFGGCSNTVQDNTADAQSPSGQFEEDHFLRGDKGNRLPMNEEGGVGGLGGSMDYLEYLSRPTCL